MTLFSWKIFQYINSLNNAVWGPDSQRFEELKKDHTAKYQNLLKQVLQSGTLVEDQPTPPTGEGGRRRRWGRGIYGRTAAEVFWLRGRAWNSGWPIHCPLRLRNHWHWSDQGKVRANLFAVGPCSHHFETQLGWRLWYWQVPSQFFTRFCVLL